jgi:hypothetical protein
MLGRKVLASVRAAHATLPPALARIAETMLEAPLVNWPAYEVSLRQRNNLTMWFTYKAIAAWRAESRISRGGQPWYSPPAILTALTLRTMFRLALRQTEGLIGFVIRLLGLDLPVPDHTTLSRRAAILDVAQP